MTKAFNQRVQRNIEKFDEDFRFQLTADEWENLRSQFVTSSWGGTRYLPHAFTEQGVYMLMTVLLQFDLPEDQREFLLLNGRAARADVTDMGIYARARKSVYIVDNYIGLKTLYLLQSVAPGVAVTVFSDNLGNRLHASDFADFRAEFPGIPVTFTTAGGIMHDRFVVLDYGDPGNGTSTAGPPPRMRRSSG